ncbi:MAG TPA: hypothetical protein VJ276_19565 [Thermoanaerobaculia bacterium]|nr:hypothetical protein [Thermoanaerobaculia bacterium]
MLRLMLVTAVVLVAAALFAPAASAQCSVTSSITYIDVWTGADGKVYVELTSYQTIWCPSAGGGGSEHYGVYQWHGGGGSYRWFYNVDGVEIGSGSGTNHDLLADDETILGPPYE